MTEMTAITKNQLISILTKSPHGSLSEYIPEGKVGAESDPEFFAHLIAWNHIHGDVRDAHVALPLIALLPKILAPEFESNAFGALNSLNVRSLLKAYRFMLELRPVGRQRKMRRLVERKLRKIEYTAEYENVWLQHRSTLRELYTLTHTKPSPEADEIIVKRHNPPGTIFAIVAGLSSMEPLEAAGTIIARKIPFQIALGALGAKAKHADLVLALLKSMTPTQVVTNVNFLKKLGVMTIPYLRSTFAEALARAAASSKNILKTTVAAEAIDDEHLKAKLSSLQEKQLDAIAGVEGNWIVLGDKSGSMKAAIDTAIKVAATLARIVKGKVSLVFFDASPRFMDATGMTYEELLERTKYIMADGYTSIGCGLLAAVEKGVEIDGIAIVSDGGENQAPWFVDVYQQLCAKSGKNIPVYLYHVRGDPDRLAFNMEEAHLDLQIFDAQDADFYSLPNLVQSMKTNRYSLADEIYATSLLTYLE
jgi:hypothetical protein